MDQVKPVLKDLLLIEKYWQMTIFPATLEPFKSYKYVIPVGCTPVITSPREDVRSRA